jgi:hypothetical protein
MKFKYFRAVLRGGGQGAIFPECRNFMKVRGRLYLHFICYIKFICLEHQICYNFINNKQKTPW